MGRDVAEWCLWVRVGRQARSFLLRDASGPLSGVRVLGLRVVGKNVGGDGCSAFPSVWLHPGSPGVVSSATGCGAPGAWHAPSLQEGWWLCARPHGIPRRLSPYRGTLPPDPALRLEFLAPLSSSSQCRLTCPQGWPLLRPGGADPRVLGRCSSHCGALQVKLLYWPLLWAT